MSEASNSRDSKFSINNRRKRRLTKEFLRRRSEFFDWLWDLIVRALAIVS